MSGHTKYASHNTEAQNMLLIEQVHKETMDTHKQVIWQTHKICMSNDIPVKQWMHKICQSYKDIKHLLTYQKVQFTKRNNQLTSSSWINLLLSCHVIYLIPLRLVKSLKQYSSSQLYLERKINIHVKWQISWKK